MLSNTITLTDDDTIAHPYDLVSRLGMDSIRREVGVSSDIGSSLLIKNTVDLNNPSAKNRHLIQLTWNEIDGTTGEIYPCSIHCVISRPKLSADATLLNKVSELRNFLSTTANMENILVGGN